MWFWWHHWPLTSYTNCGVCRPQECRKRFPHHRLQEKQLISNGGMHHGTCVTHVPWCMSGSLTRSGGENVPGIPDACATRNLVSGPSHGTCKSCPKYSNGLVLWSNKYCCCQLKSGNIFQCYAILNSNIFIQGYAVREITKSSRTFSATNITSNIIWLLQLHNITQMK